MTVTTSSPRAVLGVLFLATCLPLAVVAGTVATSGALFSDSAVDDANPIQAGSFDLKLDEVGPTNGQGSTTDESGADGVHDTWEDLDHSPLGNDVVSNTLRIDNGASTIPASRIAVSVAFVENDSDTNDGNAANTSRTIEVTTLRYDGSDLTDAELSDSNGNGHLDVEDLTTGSNADNLSSLSGIGVNATADLVIELSGSANLIDGVGAGDGIDVTVDVTAHEVSYVDGDASKNNTIRYE